MRRYFRHQATDEFNRWSESYDRCILQLLLFHPSHLAILKRIKATFGDRPINVLDVGCGTGLFASKITAALPNAKVWAMDLTPGMLEKGKPRWKMLGDRAVPVQGDSERLPFAAGSFDIVTCANSFHHYPHQQRAVDEMSRVLKPDGRLILVDGNRDWPWGWFIFDVCVATIEGAVHHCSSARMRSLFVQSGLVLENQKETWGPAPFLVTMGRKSKEAPAVPAPHFTTATAGRTLGSTL